MEYKDYLNSKDWKNLRRKAYARANGKCELCGRRAKNIHHISYPKNFSEDKLDNLLAVCDRCHKLVHGIRNLTKKQILKWCLEEGILMDKACLELDWETCSKEEFVFFIKKMTGHHRFLTIEKLSEIANSPTLLTQSLRESLICVKLNSVPNLLGGVQLNKMEKSK